MKILRLLIILLLGLRETVEAQFDLTTNGGAITIAAYTGSDGAVVIPDMTNGYPVTCIGSNAFTGNATLTNVTIPKSVTSIEDQAFFFCDSLTLVVFQGNAPNLGMSVFGSFVFPAGLNYPTCLYSPGTTGWDSNFGGCPAFLWVPPFFCTPIDNTITINAYTGSDDSLIVPPTIDGHPVISIGDQVFMGSSLTNITLPKTVESIGYQVFAQCTSLRSVYFAGNAPITATPPSFDWTEFSGDDQVTAYYLPGTLGWGAVFGDGPTADGTGTTGGAPTAQWFLPYPLILDNNPSFGMQTNKFGFVISWATNSPVVVDACTNLGNPVWSPVQTNALVNGSSYFADPTWTNYPSRLYRIHSQ